MHDENLTGAEHREIPEGISFGYTSLKAKGKGLEWD